MVQVPDVRKMPSKQAQQELQNLGLKTTLGTPVFDNKVPAGAIVKQNPAPGSKVKKDSIVELIESRGIQMVTIPRNLIDRKSADVKTQLEELGLKVEMQENSSLEEDVKQEKGDVVDLYPTENTPVNTGSTVTLFVATGESDMPLWVGQTKQNVLKDAQAKNIKITEDDFIEEESDREPGTVIRTTPEFGEPVQRGEPGAGTVEVVIAKPRETPPPDDPTEAPTSPPTPTG